MGLQLARLTREVTYGVTPGSPADGTQYDLFLPEGDAMSVRVEPKFQPIRDAGQGNRKIRMIAGRKTVGGGISTFVFPSQAPFLVGLMAGLTGSAPCYKLPSFTIDHILYTDENCAIIGRRYPGCLIADATLSCNDTDNGFLMSFKASIVGSTAADIDLDDYPNPNLSAYPGDDPYQFFHASNETGVLYIDGAVQDYKKLDIMVKNMVKPFGGEQRFSRRTGYFGRDVSFGTTLLMKSGALRADYEENAEKDVHVIFDEGYRTLKFDFGSRCNIDSVGDRTPLDDYFTQDVMFSAMVDPALSPASDLIITTTDTTPAP